MIPLATLHSFTLIALTATALAIACSLLSVIVVLRRWAFIGEGISHSGFGGAGTAWLLMLFIPALDQPWFVYLSVVVFSLGTAVAIGAMTRGRGVQTDAAIGIFLVASLAWGFLAQEIYQSTKHVVPVFFDTLLFGRLTPFSTEYTVAAIAICLVIILTVGMLWKEIIAYAFDPLLAATSGVRAGFIHYLLMVLVAMVIVIGVRIAGSVLVTALLVLPGATALQVSRKLPRVLATSILIALTGTLGGLLTSAQWRQIPAGPAIVLIMFLEFLVAYIASRQLVAKSA